MRKTLAAATVAASLAAGGLAGATFGAPVVAGAATGAASSAAQAVGWVQDALGGLVDDGTITQEQADAVEAALEEARPERGPGHGFRALALLDTVADAVGVPVEELRTRLQEGTTIAEVAEAEGVEPEVVVEAIVAAGAERITEAVADGRLTPERADALLERIEERAQALVEGELRLRHGHGPGHRFGAPGDEGASGPAETAA